MNQVVYIKAHFKRTEKKVVVRVPTGKKVRGFFGREKDEMRQEERWQEDGYSNCVVDGKRLARDIDQAVQELNSAGYEIVSISMVTSGDWNYEYRRSYALSGYGYGAYGYGYSYTEGAVILAKKQT
ncbi:MAG: hypothetical protein AAF685_13010 [Cyanobacteria bacterium P01_C01_bin.89]